MGGVAFVLTEGRMTNEISFLVGQMISGAGTTNEVVSDIALQVIWNPTLGIHFFAAGFICGGFQGVITRCKRWFVGHFGVKSRD